MEKEANAGCYRLIRNVLYILSTNLSYNKEWFALYECMYQTMRIYKYSLKKVKHEKLSMQSMFSIFPLLKWLIFFNIVCLHS